MTISSASHQSRSVLSAANVSAGYTECNVLDDITCSFEAGAVYGLIGPNGSGKTTLLRVLSGVMPPRGGEIDLHGKAIHALGISDRARSIAYVPQQLFSPMAFTVGDLVAMGRTPYLDPWSSLTMTDREIIEVAMTQTGIGHLRSRTMDRLSGGEQQRVAIAKALAQEPTVLLLDEPTAHLDIRHGWQLMELIRKLGSERELTVILSLHDLNLAAEFCDELLLLHKGVIASQGRPSSVLDQERLSRVYEHPLRVMPLGESKRLRVVPERA